MWIGREVRGRAHASVADVARRALTAPWQIPWNIPKTDLSLWIIAAASKNKRKWFVIITDEATEKVSKF